MSRELLKIWEQRMSEEVTVKGLQAKIDKWFSIRELIKQLDDKIADLNKLLTPLANELISVMDIMELKRFEGTHGKVNLITVDYVNNPQTEQDKEAFYNYLKDEGLFEQMVSVHHQKLNSFYKSKLEESEEAGTEFHIPGLEPKQRKELRKGR